MCVCVCAFARQMDVFQVEQLQGQKMRAYTEHKKRMSAETGVQRYKHSLVVDLSGASLSLGRSAKRALLKRIFDVIFPFSQLVCMCVWQFEVATLVCLRLSVPRTFSRPLILHVALFWNVINETLVG